MYMNFLKRHIMGLKDPKLKIAMESCLIMLISVFKCTFRPREPTIT